MRRRELTDAQWEKLCPLLPPQKPKVGRSAQDHRLIINGILWVVRTGAPWRDLATTIKVTVVARSGAILDGSGNVWLGDPRLEVVGTEVTVTNIQPA